MSSGPLPERAKRTLIKAKIKPGSILHLFCDFIINPDNKFVVVAHIDLDDDFLLVFLINSNIPAFIANDPIRAACQIDLLRSKYKFLDHDSYLNCDKLFDSLDIETVVDHLLKRQRDYKGRLKKGEVIEVLQAVKLTPTISDYDKDLIIKSMGNT